jgi:hypothetical protein
MAGLSSGQELRVKGVQVGLSGVAPFHAGAYAQQHRRADVGEASSEPNAAALLRHGAGLPVHRIERLQFIPWLPGGFRDENAQRYSLREYSLGASPGRSFQPDAPNRNHSY